MKIGNKKIEKYLAILFVCTLTAGVLAGCSSKTEESVTEATTKASESEQKDIAEIEISESEEKTEDTLSFDPQKDLTYEEQQFLSVMIDYARTAARDTNYIENESESWRAELEEMQEVYEFEGESMTEEEFLSIYYRFSETDLERYMQNTSNYKNDPDKVKAATLVLTPHLTQLEKLGEELSEQGVMYFADPKFWPILSDCGLDYQELYEDFVAGAAAAASVPDTWEKAFAAIEVSDNVLYEEAGVRFTFEGCTVVGTGQAARADFVFTVENKNPDNKKFFVEMQAFGVNGIALNKNISLEGPSGQYWRESDGVESGESLRLTALCSGEALQAAYDMLGATVSEYPIETAAFVFDARVGSDGDNHRMGVVLQTGAYQNEMYKKAFGEYGTTYTFDSPYDLPLALDIYGTLDERGLTAVLMPAEGLEDPFENGDFPRYVNFALNDNIANAVSDFSESGSFHEFPGFVYIYHTGMTEGELRKDNEISNSEPMEIQLYFGSTDEFVTFLHR